MWSAFADVEFTPIDYTCQDPQCAMHISDDNKPRGTVSFCKPCIEYYSHDVICERIEVLLKRDSP